MSNMKQRKLICLIELGMAINFSISENPKVINSISISSNKYC